MILIDLKTILNSDSITIIPIITLFRTPQIDKSSNIQSSPLNQNSTEKRNQLCRGPEDCIYRGEGVAEGRGLYSQREGVVEGRGLYLQRRGCRRGPRAVFVEQEGGRRKGEEEGALGTLVCLLVLFTTRRGIAE